VSVVVEIPDSPHKDELIRALNFLAIPWAPGRGADLVVRLPNRPGVPIRLWSDTRSQVPEHLFLDRAVRHILGASPTIDPRHLASTLDVIRRGPFVTLSALVDAGGDVTEHQLSSSDDRGALLAAFGDFVARATSNARVQNSLVTVADELVTNALYNAPVENGVRLFASVARSTTVPCRRPLLVRWAIDAEHVGIAVRDAYGSLTPEEVLDNLYRVRLSGGRVEEKRGGAGLGLHMLLTSASRIVFNIEPGSFTEVIVLRRHRDSWRDFLATSPTLNLCARASTIDQRRDRRLPVQWEASVTAGGRTVQVTALDISARGAFIVPAGGLQLVPGAVADITLLGGIIYEAGEWTFGHPGLPLTLRSTARWNGDSRRHNTVGTGLLFDEQRSELNEIVAALAKKDG
jgi:hypothetical protein